MPQVALVHHDQRPAIGNVRVRVSRVDYPHPQIRMAQFVARALHVITVLCLVLVGIAVFPTVSVAAALYWAGVFVAAALLVYEHSLVRADDLSKLDAAFFTMNGMISISFFVVVLAARLTSGLAS